jgi:DNA-binding transcriptional LysR family regulator
MYEKLEFMIALARERHFGHAAEACGVSQPTLSAGIKQLEDIFGVLLVQRGSRFQGFTPEGERVLDWARRIVGDTRAMRQEIEALKHGLVGHIRIAAIPTALDMVAMITTPYRARHPDVSFTVLSRTSIEVLGLLENLEIDAGITYLDNEPLGRVKTVPLYNEEYRLLISSDSRLGDNETVTWAEVARVPLCLLTPDMQNRRIIDCLLRSTGAEPAPTLESDSIIVLFTHVRTGRWASVMPALLAEGLGLTEKVRAIPIVEPETTHSIGLVVPHRDPLTPLINALFKRGKTACANLLEYIAAGGDGLKPFVVEGALRLKSGTDPKGYYGPPQGRRWPLGSTRQGQRPDHPLPSARSALSTEGCGRDSRKAVEKVR